MNNISGQYYFEFADEKDSSEILEILEEDNFQGKISLLYTRRPNAYKSIKSEGEEVFIVVCRDREKEVIAGFGVLAINSCFVNGHKKKVGYLFGLRVRKEYQKKARIIHHGYENLGKIISEKGIEFCYTTILSENNNAERLLEKKRRLMPLYEFLEAYTVNILKTNLKSEIKPNRSLIFKRAEESDFKRIEIFLKQLGQKQNLFPVLHPDDIKTKPFYVLYSKNKEEVLASGAAWDQGEYKQYIIKKYAGILRLLSPFSKLFPLFGYPPLPKAGSVLNFFTLSFWGVKDNDPDIFMEFITRLSQALSHYPFFVLGFSHHDPMQRVLRKIPHVEYTSKIYLVNWDKQESKINKLNKQYPIYLECARL